MKLRFDAWHLARSIVEFSNMFGNQRYPDHICLAAADALASEIADALEQIQRARALLANRRSEVEVAIDWLEENETARKKAMELICDEWSEPAERG